KDEDLGLAQGGNLLVVVKRSDEFDVGMFVRKGGDATFISLLAPSGDGELVVAKAWVGGPCVDKFEHLFFLVQPAQIKGASAGGWIGGLGVGNSVGEYENPLGQIGHETDGRLHFGSVEGVEMGLFQHGPLEEGCVERLDPRP